MIAESKRHKAEKILSQIPELGPVRGAQLIATIDTPFRFRTKRPFWKYLGFAVETDSLLVVELYDSSTGCGR